MLTPWRPMNERPSRARKKATTKMYSRGRREPAVGNRAITWGERQRSNLHKDKKRMDGILAEGKKLSSSDHNQDDIKEGLGEWKHKGDLPDRKGGCSKSEEGKVTLQPSWAGSEPTWTRFPICVSRSLFSPLPRRAIWRRTRELGRRFG